MASDADILLLLRRLKAVADAGVPLADGVRRLAGDASRRGLKKLAERVSAGLDEGKSIQSVLEPLVGAERAAELRIASGMCGDISDCIGLLAGLIELDMELRAELRRLSVYPLLVLFCLTVSITVIALYAEPGWLPIFELFGVDLGAGAKFVLGLGRRPAAIAGIWAVFLALYLGAAPFGTARRLWTRLRRLVPGMRNMCVLEDRARLCRALRLLIAADVPLSDGADLLSRLCPDAVDRQTLLRFEEGESFWNSLRESAVVDRPLRDLLVAGEKAGALRAVLGEVEKLSLEEMSDGGRRFVHAAGFALIGAVGTIVGVTYYLLLSPYFRLFARS
jgi:type IV pilus assembly protein PilC